MSDTDFNQAPMVSPEVTQSAAKKSKKRAKPEQMSNITKITDFFSGGNKKAELSDAADGGSLDLRGSLASQNSNQEAQYAQQVTPERTSKTECKQSTASSQSPDSNEQSKDIYKPRPENSVKDQSHSQSSKVDASKKEKAKNKKAIGSQEGTEKKGKDRSHQGDDDDDHRAPRENRDHCNICKDGGELICCDKCPRSFHLKCLGLTEADIPEGDWYCDRCKPIVDKRKAQEEEKRKKAEEREKLLQDRRNQLESLKKDKENEAEKKREEKRKEKERAEEAKSKQREQILGELKSKLQQSKDQSLSASQNLHDNKIEAPNSRAESPKRNGSKFDTISVSSPSIKGGDLKKSKKVTNKGKDDSGSTSASVQRKTEEKSEAEKAKEQKSATIRQLLKIFAKHYPELVDKYSIKYPIEDQLIKKMPILHGAENFPEKPETKKVLIRGDKFESILYIWEFFNNFTDYFEINNFKIEELQAALSFDQDPTKTQLYSEDEDNLSWDQKMNQKAIQEQGFGLITSLHMTLLKQFLKTLNPSEKNKGTAEGGAGKVIDDEDEDHLVLAVNKHIENKELVWPELIRLIMQSKKKFNFQPLDPSMNHICDKLAGCRSETYGTSLTYDDKIELLSFLIDNVHELDEFRSFLNSRLEEKSSYNKQKMDIYAEIKQLETQKQELIKEHSQSNFFNNSEEILKQIEELKVQLEKATRTEAKKIRDQIFELQAEKNKILREMEKIDEQIEKRHTKIERLNEQAHKTSIKTQMLGKDADKNEYWFFKEEPGKLFIKKQEPTHNNHLLMEIDESNGMIDIPEPAEPQFHWLFYDEEEEFEKLIEGCNTKGIRERKLQENLKKIRDRMKMKKGAKAKAKNEEGKEEEKEGDQVSSQEQAKDPSKDKHHLFENDNWEQSLQNAIWYGKKMPPKKKGADQLIISTRRGYGQQQQNQKNAKPEEEKLTLESQKLAILNIEEFYSDASLPFSREWESKEKREEFREQLLNADSVDKLAKLLLQLDYGFSHPNFLRLKGDKGKEEVQSDSKDSDEEMDSESQEEGSKKGSVEDRNVYKYKVGTFKFWPSQEYSRAWRNYVFQDCQCQGNNLNALLIATKILQRVTEEFVQKLTDNHLKKQKKEERRQQRGRPSENTGKPGKGGYKRDKPDYKQYFESSDEEDDEEEEEEVQNDRSRRAQQRNGKGKRREESDSDADVDSNEEESVEESNEESSSEEKEWDDKCHLCGKGGNVMCCGGCTHVAHLACTGLKKEPQGDWHCEDCLFKQTQRRTTRNQSNKQNNKVGRLRRHHK